MCLIIFITKCSIYNTKNKDFGLQKTKELNNVLLISSGRTITNQSMRLKIKQRFEVITQKSQAKNNLNYVNHSQKQTNFVVSVISCLSLLLYDFSESNWMFVCSKNQISAAFSQLSLFILDWTPKSRELSSSSYYFSQSYVLKGCTSTVSALPSSPLTQRELHIDSIGAKIALKISFAVNLFKIYSVFPVIVIRQFYHFL